MRKALALFLLLVLLVCPSLSSCTRLYGIYVEGYDPELYRTVVFTDDPFPTLSYRGVRYVLEKDNWFCSMHNGGAVNTDLAKEGVLLGWDAAGYSYFYYSYTADDPLYIYDGRQYYFRGDYDPYADEFVMDGGLGSITLGEIAVDAAELDWPFLSAQASVVLRSVARPELRIVLRLYFTAGEWYVLTTTSHYHMTGASEEYPSIRSEAEFRLSDELRAFLLANNALPEPPAAGE